jgi:hypothetical protein
MFDWIHLCGCGNSVEHPELPFSPANRGPQRKFDPFLRNLPPNILKPFMLENVDRAWVRIASHE